MSVGQIATSPFQFALSTRAGCECVARALHELTEEDPEATMLSIDGISAFDLISRSAMLRGLASITGGLEAIPFFRMSCGQPSLYIWEDDESTVHQIHQREESTMQLLFALGQHRLLCRKGSYLDDVYVKTLPARVGAVYA